MKEFKLPGYQLAQITLSTLFCTNSDTPSTGIKWGILITTSMQTYWAHKVCILTCSVFIEFHFFLIIMNLNCSFNLSTVSDNTIISKGN